MTTDAGLSSDLSIAMIGVENSSLQADSVCLVLGTVLHYVPKNWILCYFIIILIKTNCITQVLLIANME